jgi:hypothetical protein
MLLKAFITQQRVFMSVGDDEGADVNAMSRMVGHKLPSFTLRHYSSAEGRKQILETSRTISKAIERELREADFTQ